MNNAKKANIARGIVCRVVLIIFLAFTLLPAWVMIVNSFKTPNQLLDGVLWFAFPLNFGNYADAFEKISPYIWNSVSVSVVSTVGITFIAALTGYAFGHFEFKGKNFLFSLIMVNMMVPSVLTLVPSYLVVVNLRLYDTQFAVLLPYLGGGSLGLIQFNQQQGANRGAMFAGYILTSLPLLAYFTLNLKSFMDSLTEGAVKQ